MAAVAQHGAALQFASEEMRKDKEVALAAVRADPLALASVDPELQGDKDVVLAAVRGDAWALAHAAEELWGDRDVLVEAMMSTADVGDVLESFAPGWFKYDKEFVFVAIAASDRKSILQVYAWVEKTLKEDREIVMAAAAKSSAILQVAPPEMRNDREVILAALRCKDGAKALKMAPRHLVRDRSFLMEAVEVDGDALKYAHEDDLNNKRLALVAVNSNGRSLRLLSRALRDDIDVVTAAVQEYPRALRYASDALRHDSELVNLMCEGTAVETRGDTRSVYTDKMSDYQDHELERGGGQEPRTALSELVEGD
uniref:DUF4116 domain-containing protein n=1 Tax=Pinguiococcus pyrenoidosus TaxID=172671 RepID=A0A7R9U6T0_9STRA